MQLAIQSLDESLFVVRHKMLQKTLDRSGGVNEILRKPREDPRQCDPLLIDPIPCAVIHKLSRRVIKLLIQPLRDIRLGTEFWTAGRGTYDGKMDARVTKLLAQNLMLDFLWSATFPRDTERISTKEPLAF